jgi:MOSC domain-containing protein YiiM
MSALELRLISVNVALPRAAGERNGEPFESAFRKQKVTAATIEVGKTNLAGDAQANLEKHGGPERAVYAYPTDNWPWWEKEHRFACAPGTFGENLTVAGADESAIAIGDRFSWGEAVLEVSQPRLPCHKFQRFSGREDASALMTLSGRCGWLFRVLATGRAPVEGSRLVRIGESGGPSVREVFLAGSDRRTDPARRRALAEPPGLAPAWRKKLSGEA